MLTPDITIATAMPQTVATAKMASRNVSATVVALTGISLWYKSTIPETMANAAGNCKIRIKRRAFTALFYRSFPGAAQRE